MPYSIFTNEYLVIEKCNTPVSESNELSNDLIRDTTHGEPTSSNECKILMVIIWSLARNEPKKGLLLKW